MNREGGRPKRRIKVKSVVPLKVPRKWTEDEMETLLDCIMEHGHKDLDKIKERLPGRSLENIKTFMRTVYDSAGKLGEEHANLDAWINHSTLKHSGEAWRDSLQIAQVLKYLSVDGLLENHPLPERCEGIDFGLAYKFIYQTVMGYPIQPLNQATLDFIHETIGELNSQLKEEKNAIKNVNLFLKQKLESEGNEPQVPVNVEKEVITEVKKPLKVYQRKKSNSLLCVDSKVPLRIKVEECDSKNTGLGYVKDYSVTFEGCQSAVVNVPVPVVDTQKKQMDEAEEQLLKSPSYNPFQIPEKWLEEPLYKNLLQKP